MKCPNCGHDNNIKAQICRKCGADLMLPPAWWPNWRWHIKTLAYIYLALVIGFFALSFLLHRLPPPYDQREISPEMTPWLNHRAKAKKQDKHKAKEKLEKAPEKAEKSGKGGKSGKANAKGN